MQGTYPVQDTVRLWSPWVFTMALRGTFQIAVALRRYWNHSKVCWNSWILQYYCARNHISCNYLHAWWKISDNNFKMYMGVYSFSTFFCRSAAKEFGNHCPRLLHKCFPRRCAQNHSRDWWGGEGRECVTKPGSFHRYPERILGNNLKENQNERLYR